MMSPGHRTLCRLCGGDEGLLLHTVHHQSHYRRLCTDCVLKTHPSLFCSTCLAFLPGGDRVACLRCPSVSHRKCLAPSFRCASCSSPGSSFFDKVAIDLRSATALVAAARVSVESMGRAADRARVDAERRVGESVLANRRAVEAMEVVRVLWESEDGVGVGSEWRGVSGGGGAVGERRGRDKAADPKYAMWLQRRFGSNEGVDAAFTGAPDGVVIGSNGVLRNAEFSGSRDGVVVGNNVVPENAAEFADSRDDVVVGNNGVPGNAAEFVDSRNDAVVGNNVLPENAAFARECNDDEAATEEVDVDEILEVLG